MNWFYLVIITSVDIPRHAEVCYFNCEIFSNQTIPAGEVSMNKVLASEIVHSASDLDSDRH